MKMVPDIIDRYYITYGVFYMMGMLVYVPFHMFTHAYLYWNFKFQDPCFGDHTTPCPPHPGPPPPRGEQAPPTLNYERNDIGPPPDRNTFQMFFASSFRITTHGTLFVFLLLAIVFSNRMPPPVKRIPGALLATCFLFAISAIMTQIRLSVQLLFGISIVIVALMNLCSAISVISLYELVTKFPVSYYASIISGQSICGILAVLVQLALIGARLPPEMNGTVFFTLGTTIMLATTAFFLFLMRRSKFFIYTIQDHSEVSKSTRINDVRALSRGKLWSVLRKLKWYYVSLVLVQGSTAMVHPGLTTLVVPIESDTEWSELYFTPVISCLLFSVCNLIGRESAKIVKTAKNGMMITVASVIRLAFVPLMIFCNAQPRVHLPVYFGDSSFVLMIGIIAFTEGILINIVILAIPAVVLKEEIEAAVVMVPCVSLTTVSLCSALNMVINKLI